VAEWIAQTAAKYLPCSIRSDSDHNSLLLLRDCSPNHGPCYPITYTHHHKYYPPTYAATSGSACAIAAPQSKPIPRAHNFDQNSHTYTRAYPDPVISNPGANRNACAGHRHTDQHSSASTSHEYANGHFCAAQSDPNGDNRRGHGHAYRHQRARYRYANYDRRTNP